LPVSEQRKTKVKEAGQDKIDLEGENQPLAPEQVYLQRKAEVTRQDHAEFRTPATLTPKPSGTISSAS
jgi:hypothetical protein